MRLLITVLVLVFSVLLLGFLVTNLEATVEVVIWNTVYPDVELWKIVLGSVMVSVILIGIAFVAEGTNIRLANRRLRREIQRQETEINYLRTQTPSTGRSEPDTLAGERSAPAEKAAPARERPAPPSAPVYGAEGDETGGDDDIYSGGRAV